MKIYEQPKMDIKSFNSESIITGSVTDGQLGAMTQWQTQHENARVVALDYAEDIIKFTF